MKSKLLTRDEFREGVFKRDGHRCVFCGEPAVDAHHIIERRIWGNGGYFLDNGASVCEEHHIECEKTNITVEQVREKCGITKPVFPEHFYHDQIYDKWGNIILPNGQRLKGELFYDLSVQKILADVLNQFTSYVKYPRTYHTVWSENLTEDDRVCKDMKHFEGKEIVVTEKLDGENTSMYSDFIHARSLSGDNHISRNWVKNFWSIIRHDIPEGYRICGENLWAKHTIKYDNLKTYFYGFSMWNEKNECLDWSDTIQYFELLGITHVPVLYSGIYNEKAIRALYQKENAMKMEGYVIRLKDKFNYGDFKNSVVKFVAKPFKEQLKDESNHWRFGKSIEQNGIDKLTEV